MPTPLGRALCGLRRSAAAPRQAPGLHLADLALLRFDGHQRQVVDLWSGRLLQREAPGLNCALLVMNQRVDELLIERGGVRNWAVAPVVGRVQLKKTPRSTWLRPLGGGRAVSPPEQRGLVRGRTRLVTDGSTAVTNSVRATLRGLDNSSVMRAARAPTCSSAAAMPCSMAAKLDRRHVRADPRRARVAPRPP